MKTISMILAAVLSIGLAPSCQSVAKGKTEEERVRIREVMADEARYRSTAERFVRHAQRGNSNAMLNMVSRRGIQELGGEAAVRSMIEKDVLHGFADVTVEWRQKASWGYTPKDRTIGLWFQGTTRRPGWHNRFRIFVLEEQGRLVVGQIADDSAPH